MSKRQRLEIVARNFRRMYMTNLLTDILEFDITTVSWNLSVRHLKLKADLSIDNISQIVFLGRDILLTSERPWRVQDPIWYPHQHRWILQYHLGDIPKQQNPYNISKNSWKIVANTGRSTPFNTYNIKFTDSIFWYISPIISSVALFEWGWRILITHFWRFSTNLLPGPVVFLQKSNSIQAYTSSKVTPFAVIPCTYLVHIFEM